MERVLPLKPRHRDHGWGVDGLLKQIHFWAQTYSSQTESLLTTVLGTVVDTVQILKVLKTQRRNRSTNRSNFCEGTSGRGNNPVLFFFSLVGLLTLYSVTKLSGVCVLHTLWASFLGF